MNHTEATKYIKATIAAFGPGEAISMTKETWAKLHAAMKALASVAKEQPAPSQYGSPELQAMIVARAMEKNAAEQPAQRTWVNATTWRG